MIVTENGVEDAEDKMRPRYIAQHIHQMWRAVNFNWPIKGYFHWSMVDNFEWERGWSMRFGLWGLDVDTQKESGVPALTCMRRSVKRMDFRLRWCGSIALKCLRRFFHHDLKYNSPA